MRTPQETTNIEGASARAQRVAAEAAAAIADWNLFSEELAKRKGGALSRVENVSDVRRTKPAGLDDNA